MLGQISDIRSEAESRIKHALRDKHRQEVISSFYLQVYIEKRLGGSAQIGVSELYECVGRRTKEIH